MQTLSHLQSQLGIMTWPLIIMSFLTLVILIERTLYMLLNGRTYTSRILKQVHKLDFNHAEEVDRFIADELGGRQLAFQSMRMLLNHRHFTKPLREEAVSIWLFKKRQQFRSGIRLLSMIGVISPLIGLLGTVLGLMEMFKGITSTEGAISPANLADGLGLAMTTTAAGLLIALPAIMGAQLLSMWVEKTLAKIEYTLNHSNLHIEGISVDPCAENLCADKACSNKKIFVAPITDEVI
ncbi:biopolymer transport protein [Vibrio ichthyoenteri ATCC 700023]|uniref:Biopolymer transport protein n=1 Tax=Vibrio ichthyoenteri ATCC 700023 TaxID=870968 RepID=F9RZB1_9VIBR|nr:MotA/TolQ/ExbB proton channel family protein [Vibrio ichthyoenteri]EGU45513.1 biopolymer transport protein [Vibrio ichthyoenteri ATCC 700023]